ncbi:MAG: YwbE family protein [Candidatus Methanoperedens sp.]
MNEVNNRVNIKVGLNVGVVLKQDQRSGKITRGIVKRILTNSSHHPHGIKVELENGQVGRVKEIHFGKQFEIQEIEI